MTGRCCCAGVAAAIARIEARQSAVESAVAELLSLSRPRRQAVSDDGLFLALAGAARGRRFTSGDLWRHRTVDDGLAAALDAAWIENAIALGCFLTRSANRVVEDIVLCPAGETRAGNAWCFRSATVATDTGAPSRER
jgi:hypothetical protein